MNYGKSLLVGIYSTSAQIGYIEKVCSI